jgi:hypothetical protein
MPVIVSTMARLTHNHIRWRGDFNGNQYLVSANLPIPTLSQSEVAEQLNVSERLVRCAHAIQTDGTSELMAAVNH